VDERTLLFTAGDDDLATRYGLVNFGHAHLIECQPRSWAWENSLTLLMAIDAGMDMTDEVTKFSGGTPSPMYAVSTEPAMVENPEVMARWSSDAVITKTPVSYVCVQ
jgi:hypothetical protein